MCPCHLILLAPVVGLLLFWLLPPGYALPISIVTTAVIVLISGFLYWPIRRAMRKPAEDGFQSLVGTEAEVVAKSASDHSIKYLVRAQDEGELWSAYSKDVLEIGEPVKIVTVKGISLVVERGNGCRSKEAGKAS